MIFIYLNLFFILLYRTKLLCSFGEAHQMLLRVARLVVISFNNCFVVVYETFADGCRFISHTTHRHTHINTHRSTHAVIEQSRK